MMRIRKQLLAVMLMVTACVTLARRQDSAPSSHMVFDDRFDGDILINEVRVPKDGEAMYTYYETLGWSGIGSGYTGIQVHPKAHLYIFSIWDNKKHRAPIKAEFLGPGTEATPFGGEGTGLKSWNFKLGWSPDVWYTFILRSWHVGENTMYGTWVRAGDTKKWTHLVTMDVSAADGRFRGGADAFIEDWSSSGINRRISHLRGGWKRKMDGSWFPFSEGRYSVNTWDLTEGKRSYNFRNSWDAGVSKDKTGPFYYMVSGGKETKPKVKNPSKHSIERKEKSPDYEKIKIGRLLAEIEDKSIAVKWETDDTTLPQFAYKIQIFADKKGKSKALVSKTVKKADCRTETLDASSLNLSKKTYYLHLQCIDILDGVSDTKTTKLGK